MSNSSFGQELKNLRKQAGIPSKVLSQRVGKAVTYVSQLEREKIKNPSYDTCLEILVKLGLNQTDAEKLLTYYGIHSKEEKRSYVESGIKLHEELNEKIESYYYVKKFEEIGKKKSRFLELADKNLSVLGQYDSTKADLVLHNLNKLMETEENAAFFFSLFENDFSRLSDENRDILLNTVKQYYKKTNSRNIVEEMGESE
ncbi:helix-turn-helix domain-containing protein [Planococcus halotolerans]|uniref:helix-turn-helix domain-containing protein n=1 Tax=Planococcus halotolerans TaxID=2233542 RepID=UPI001401BCB1|nr:helix-turn-helix transcriptional regulator [Planococcus halotolerans]